MTAADAAAASPLAASFCAASPSAALPLAALTVAESPSLPRLRAFRRCGGVDDSLQKVPVHANGLLTGEGGRGFEFEQVPAGDEAGDDGDRLRQAFLAHDSVGEAKDVGRAAPLLDDDPGVLACEGGISRADSTTNCATSDSQRSVRKAMSLRPSPRLPGAMTSAKTRSGLMPIPTDCA